MKTVILAGGLGSRLSEETQTKPKPMVEIGGRPILWHIMKLYSSHGINDFVICVGYKGYIIKEYFANYALHMSDITFDMAKNTVEVHQRNAEPWRITIVDTGDASMTGGRLRRVRDYVNGETFCMTYGDGVSDVNITALIEFHRSQRKMATLTAVQPPGRFGSMVMEGTRVTRFQEKPEGDNSWINGGFFVLEPDVIERISGDSTIWERAPMESLAKDGHLAAYKHTGFWYAMDTLRDRNHLEELWARGAAPWKRW